MSLVDFFNSPKDVLYMLDLMGVIACAFAGTLLAKHKGLDGFGCILVAMVNAIGGGTVRDVLLNRQPFFWMEDLNYLWVITLVSLLVQVFFYFAHRIDSLIKRFDAVGLAAFTLIGLKIGLNAGVAPVIAVLMGVITSIFGGLVRDIICNEIPLVLRQEIYITAGLIGSITYLILIETSLSSWLVDVICLILIYCIRMLAVHLDWHLPDISLKKVK